MNAPVRLSPMGTDPFQNAYSADVEKAILAVLLDGRHPLAFGTLADRATPDDFHVRDHRLIALVVFHLGLAGARVDAGSVAECAKTVPYDGAALILRAGDGTPRKLPTNPSQDYADSLLANLGGFGGIHDLTGAYAPAAGFAANVEILVRYAKQRRLIATMEGALRDLIAIDGSTKARAIGDRVINQTSVLLGAGRASSSIAACADTALVEHDAAAAAGDSPAASWGVDALDAACRLAVSRLVVCAARPGCGKTSLMLQAAVATARMHGADSVALVTLEMPGTDLARIIIGREIRVSRSAIERGWMTYEQRQAYEQSAAAWKANDIPIKDQGERCTAADLCAWLRTRHLRAGGRLRLVCIDYLQLVQGANPKQTENDRLGEITRALKLLANELRVCVLLLSQLNRASAKETRAPDLHDLRGSGSIEQDADSVVFLHSDAEPSPSMPVQALVAKQRGGEQGKAVSLVFNRARGQEFKGLHDEPQAPRAPNSRMFEEPSDDEDLFKNASEAGRKARAAPPAPAPQGHEERDGRSRAAGGADDREGPDAGSHGADSPAE